MKMIFGFAGFCGGIVPMSKKGTMMKSNIFFILYNFCFVFLNKKTNNKIYRGMDDFLSVINIQIKSKPVLPKEFKKTKIFLSSSNSASKF